MSSESQKLPTKTATQQLKEAFRDAEREIHKTENCSQKVPVAALNELRYAGSHMLVFLEEGEATELEQALQHSRRAYFDAQRFLLLYLMWQAQAIRDGIGEHISEYTDLVAKAYSAGKYGELKQGMMAAKAYIQEMSQIKIDSKRWENRGDNFEECKPYIQSLRDYITVYDSLAEEFVQLRQKAKQAKLEAEKEAKDKRRNFILGVLGLIAAIVGAIAAF